MMPAGSLTFAIKLPSLYNAMLCCEIAAVRYPGFTFNNFYISLFTGKLTVYKIRGTIYKINCINILFPAFQYL